MDLKKELLNLIKAKQDLNPLLEENNEYAFALLECVKDGFVSGLSCKFNANGIPVFRELP